jgi:dipeptidyl aminopeptidase/acylaminoacyl peptidase
MVQGALAPRRAHPLVRGSALALVVGFALLVGGSLQAAPLSVADAFKTTPIVGMQLSPDGQRVLAFVASREGTGVILFDLATRKPQQLRAEIPGRPWTARWLGKDLVVVAVGAETHVYEPSGKLFRQIEGRFVGTLLPDEQGHERVVVRAHGDGVERVDVRTGRSTRIPFAWPASGDPVRWIPDREGVPRVVTTMTRDRTSLTHWVRESASAPWQALESQLAIDARWTPLAIARDGRSLIVSSAEGRDTEAVFRYSLDEHALKEMMVGHPTEDIGQATLADGDDDMNEGVMGSIVRVVTLGMRTSVHWFDPKWAALQRSVDAALPGRVNLISGSFATGTMLVLSTGDVDPGTWYVLDVAATSLRQLDAVKPEIDRRAMRPMQIVRYRSLDGTEIPAYLTLPADAARNAPAVVLVHGGPVVRDRWAWNPEVQLLASRGYAVLQPQFRGSSGFGKRFELAGLREWGRAMQDDVTAGAQWLAEQGIADPRRMCVYGSSYGGYAALWALVKTPRLFRCGASVAGVSDLGLLLTGDSDVNRQEIGRLSMLRTIGDAQADAQRLEEVSPLRQAARIEVPVLLAHGDLDRRVPIVHSEKMLEALKKNGKQVRWIMLRGEGHGIGHAENRELFYNALFDFLARNTAAPANTAGFEPPQAAASAPK